MDFTPDRVSINIAPEVRERLENLLHSDAFPAVGYSAFIDRACEAAEAEHAEKVRLKK